MLFVQQPEQVYRKQLKLKTTTPKVLDSSSNKDPVSHNSTAKMNNLHSVIENLPKNEG